MLHIKNALICDGTGKEPYPGEVLVDGGKIAAVGPAPLGELDAEIWDAQEELITPGFIDTHRHCDLAALYDSDFGEIELAPAPRNTGRIYTISWSHAWARPQKKAFSLLCLTLWKPLPPKSIP